MFNIFLNTLSETDSTNVALPDTTSTRVIQHSTGDTSPQTVDVTTREIQQDDAGTVTTNIRQQEVVNNSPARPLTNAENQETNNSRQPVTQENVAKVANDTVSVAQDTSTISFEYDLLPVKVIPFEGKLSDIFDTTTIKSNDGKYVRPYTTSTIGEGIPIERSSSREVWMDIFSLGLIVYFTLVLVFTRRFLVSLFPLIFNNQKSHRQFEEDSKSYLFSVRLYTIPSILIVSIYLVFARDNGYIFFGNLDLTLFELIIYIFCALCLIAVFKQVFFKLIGFVSLSQNFVSELSFNRQLILIAASLLLFLPAVLLPLYEDNPAFQNILLIIGLAVISAAFIGILIRSLILFRLSRASLFLWILYLCILEIGPYLVLFILFQ